MSNVKTPRSPIKRSRRLSGPNRTRLLIAAAVLVIATAVWIVSDTQRSAANRVFEESNAAQRMMIAMLDQETALRGYAITRREEFLAPFVRGVGEFERAAGKGLRLAHEDAQRVAILSQMRSARRWRALAREEIAHLRRSARLSGVQEAIQRKLIFDSFRRQNASFVEVLADERRRELDRAGVVSVLVIVLLSIGFGGFGNYLIVRETNRIRAHRARQRGHREAQEEFAATMQVMRTEPEAHELVRHHLERSIEGSDVVVLNRNNSDNRLMATTQLGEDSELAQKLVDAEPESCLSVRLGRTYEQGETVDPLLTCELCGASAAEIMCVPSLVSGEVIGSVLVRHSRQLEEEERGRVTDSVTQAAPVLANLRNLAIAENRATTDALTGLDNSRSCRDNIKRMVAHAGRTVSPLSAVLLDLDRFKQVNDRFGHGAGDDVLAAIGEVIGATLRTSDFGGRYGGEEFLLLLPDTDHSGALETAEKLRRSIEHLELTQPELTVSASFGVATYPLDALDGDSLIRMADRALYAAKAAGRNRVELADATVPDPGMRLEPESGDGVDGRSTTGSPSRA